MVTRGLVSLLAEAGAGVTAHECSWSEAPGVDEARFRVAKAYFSLGALRFLGVNITFGTLELGIPTGNMLALRPIGATRHGAESDFSTEVHLGFSSPLPSCQALQSRSRR